MHAPWIMLTVAGLLEVGWAIGLKYTDGFNLRARPAACTATLAAMIASMYLLALAVRTIPIGTGYAIWTGIGALGAATLGMILFREPATVARIGCVILIVAGIVGLKLTSPPASGAEPMSKNDTRIAFYVGGYGEGVGRAMLNVADKTLSDVIVIAPMKGASFLALHPRLPALYAVSESARGSVHTFRIGDRGSLPPVGVVASGGDGPCHLGITAKGDRVFAANYGGGSVAAFDIDPDGNLREPRFVDQHAGSSVVKARQAGPRAHCVVADPSGRFAISADLGTDELIVYRIDEATMKRVGANKMPPGTGPRHVAISADGRFVYVVGELSNRLLTFALDANSGTLQSLDSLSLLPADFNGESAAAEVAIHPTGRFLYASNRGHDSLAVFRLDIATGKATALMHVPSGGKGPRHFSIDPSGRFIIVANQTSNVLVAFELDPATGIPTPTGSTASAASPSCVVFDRP